MAHTPHVCVLGKTVSDAWCYFCWLSNCVHFSLPCLWPADSEEEKAVSKKKRSTARQGKNESSKCYQLFISCPRFMLNAWLHVRVINFRIIIIIIMSPV